MGRSNAIGSLKLDSLQECTYIIFMIEFELDPKKSDSNLKKHGVSFYEAKSVFTMSSRFSSLMTKIHSQQKIASLRWQ